MSDEDTSSKSLKNTFFSKLIKMVGIDPRKEEPDDIARLYQDTKDDLETAAPQQSAELYKTIINSKWQQIVAGKDENSEKERGGR